MKWLLSVVVVSLLSCGDSQSNNETKKDSYEGIAGEWIVAYPTFEEIDSKGQKLYAEIQDSILSVQGLQLVRFAPDGSFYRTDSIDVKGRWLLSGNSALTINGGGNGFDPFRADNISYKNKNKEMELTERVYYKDYTVKVTWHLARLTNRKDTINDLFSEMHHRWRRKPTAPESDEAIKERLAAALSYHSNYYMMVAQHANYFLSSRIILPLAFYQHALGLKPFSGKSAFASLFYDSTQALTAHAHLENTMRSIAGSYPRNENYVIGYAHCMRQMAAYLRGKNDWR